MVKDRFKISFDWNPTQSMIVSKPVFKNFPSTVPANIFVNPCQPPPPLTGTYDTGAVACAVLVVGGEREGGAARDEAENDNRPGNREASPG